MNTPLIRWTIGPVKKAGFDCLKQSVHRFKKLHPDVRMVICHNQLTPIQLRRLEMLEIPLINQNEYKNCIGVPPIGVAWKLYPPRLSTATHELFIDNDLIIEKHIEEIDRFLAGDMTLLLQETTRHYGKFERHVPPGYYINSGVFGIPPEFPFGDYIKFYTSSWEENATGEHKESRTFDEQGLVATILLSYKKFIIIPYTSIINTSDLSYRGNYTNEKGIHFVGLNRKNRHRPFIEYKFNNTRHYL